MRTAPKPLEKTLRPILLVLIAATCGATFGACGGGAHFEKGATVPSAGASSSGPVMVAAPPPPSASVAKHPEATKSARWLWAAVGCWVGGAWSEALGAAGEEKHLATTRRCRIVANEALATKDDDAPAVEAVRAMKEAATARAIEAIAAVSDDHAGVAALLTATANAAREASLARSAAAKGDAAKGDGNNAADVTASAALAKLQTLPGKLSSAAQTIALVLAADRIEATRALAASTKSAAGNAVFAVVFGSKQTDDWTALLTSIATKGGHPPQGKHERDALAGVFAVFADRFATLANLLESAPKGVTLGGGDARAVAEGYAALLRNMLKGEEKKADPGKKVGEPAKGDPSKQVVPAKKVDAAKKP